MRRLQLILNDKERRMNQSSPLREIAENMALKRGIPLPENLDALVPEDFRLLFHELSVHQIELEIQNEELRKTQGELDNALARYFDLYDNAPVGYCTLTGSGLIVEANLTLASLLKVSWETLIRQPISRFIFMEDQDIYYLHHKQEMAEDTPYECELRMVKEDGTVFWAHLVTTFTRQGGGGSEYRVVLRDITKRKRDEAALQQSEQRAKEARNFLKAVLDAVPVRLFWKDLSSVYLGCNLAFAQDAGYSVPEELIGLDDHSLGWKEQAEQYRRDDVEVMTSGTSRLHYEEPQTTPDGSRRWLATSKVPLRDADDRVIGVLGAYDDITQRKWVEEELLTKQKLESLGILAGGIAHDFNNILMVIMGNISFAKSLLSPTDKVYARLSAAEAASLQAKEITQQFLTFSNGGTPVKRPVSVGDLLRNYGRFALSGTPFSCEYTIPDDLWLIDADEEQIGRALTNILINADQSMPDGGTIRIHCENTVIPEGHTLPLKSGKYVKISIKDQGCGIPAAYLRKIFDPYFTTKERGHGLGLALSYSILKKHEGHICVESNADSGTVFTLYIPASSEDNVVLSDGGDSDIRTGKGRILVMDDDEGILQIVGVMLEELGYEVELVQDGKAMLEKYIDAGRSFRPFDAVLMDLTVVGGMGGKEAMEKLLVVDPQARVIVSSGYNNDPVMANYASYGFQGALAKPYQLPELSQQVWQVFNNECLD